MAALLTACSGFLLAVLWMDLMFDVQALRRRTGAQPLPEPVLASIGGYYHRATTASQPMGRLIAVVMLILLSALGFEAFRGHEPPWVLWTSVVLAGVPIGLALTRTVPRAVRLGHRVDTAAEQSRLARTVGRDHLVCAACMLAFVVVWTARGLSG
ncbi:hypothetical protein BST27_14400 [Mycobacterium intermedium]|uniref:DUF1772 domain-containing protein n=1 Tax=Mycobacterium intermedium TaxID=28445 RepID=A0A1E3SIJ4_MYCIE|nr:hypothetical protein [Mycobacterium intermedium]MCV6964305.1 hypothetical protein [Mycobacterium intermedium]ODR01925.1 hypothetical protein BHQ20_06655 [Mycobacterium intermedium]OPE51016.1 hypothetical protein BV508_08090 [Mycobacterium intermedium]ORB04214.1 hypothetical protein BST27_14400 [Mycobacterium intermedium]